jgi:hypothetical protein
MYAAVDATIEGDLSRFPPVIVHDDRTLGIYQDFLGGLNPAQLENLAYSVIHNIASFPDHLRQWAKKNGRDPSQINAVQRESLPFRQVADLSNNDKHGYPPRRGGRSGQAPKLTDVNRVLRLSTGAAKGSSVRVMLSPSGPVVRASGGGSANVVVTGSIVDADGTRLGALHEIWLEAIGACERMLAAVG